MLAAESALYRDNDPERFWRLLSKPAPSRVQWAAAVGAAASQLPAAVRAEGDASESLLARTLGEGQFGPDHFSLSPAKRAYYRVKPWIPRAATRIMRRLYRGSTEPRFPLGWPIESRYATFQWAVVHRIAELANLPNASFIDFWPEGRALAFVLTHDVETADGQAYVREVADLEASLGFRSSFNFVPERYRLDHRLLDELRERGFEIGVHGLNHDGGDFRSFREFMRRVPRVNGYVKEFGAVGYRAPLTHRHPLWMQALDIEYDLSFFDTDPYEPMAGGTMSLWPFVIGRFVELPYTLVQDYTLTAVLGEATARIWLDKVGFIRSQRGMALALTHPDYLRNRGTRKVYEEFLRAMRAQSDYWHALPREVARWWRARMDATSVEELPGAVARSVAMDSGALTPPVLVRSA